MGIGSGLPPYICHTAVVMFGCYVICFPVTGIIKAKFTDGSILGQLVKYPSRKWVLADVTAKVS